MYEYVLGIFISLTVEYILWKTPFDENNSHWTTRYLIENLFSSSVQKTNDKSLSPLKRILFEINFKTIQIYFGLFFNYVIDIH